MHSIVLDRRLFKPQKARKVKLYCLDCHTIGITDQEVKAWKSFAFHNGSVHPKRMFNGDFKVIFPKKIQRFYCMQQNDTKLVATYSDNGRTVLITVSREEP